MIQVGQISGLFMVEKGQATPTRTGELVRHKSEADEGGLCHHKESLFIHKTSTEKK